LGFEPDRQNIVPHLTLGRIKILHDKQGFQKVVEQLRSIKSKSLICDSFILYESILKIEGPEYKALGVFPLLTEAQK
jgi:2'-5' RNA ligase